MHSRYHFFVSCSVVILTLNENWTNTRWQPQSNNTMKFVCSNLMAVRCCKRSALASVSRVYGSPGVDFVKNIYLQYILVVLFLRNYFPLLDDVISVCQYQKPFNCCEMLWDPQERCVIADEFSIISSWISSGRWGTFFP